jgi:uncharacterized protein (DUF2147 family)
VLRGTKTQSTQPSRLALTLACVLPALVVAAGASAQPGPREAGLWYDDSGKGAVELAPCGAKLCGRIVWLKDQVNAQGKPLVDRYNPNPARRTTPICGLQVIGDVQRMPEGNWDSGWIYDPKTGASYNVTLALQSDTQLKVTGYKGIKLLSKSFTWTRAPADLPRCNGAPAGEGVPEPAKGGDALPWAKD